ncbi:MAG: hypothetical protein FWC93_03205 [Defluviitaleaceae bacterium]|nr:hypothetical protein [Defluviitaleaceae bacterium]
MTWRPVEPLSRTPWTADFAAAKGRAIIFGVLAVVLLSLVVIGNTRFEHTYGLVWSSRNHVNYWVDGQTYTFRLSDQIFRGAHAAFPGGSAYLFVGMLVDVNDPQNVIILPRFFPTSGMIFIIAGLFAAASLYCGVVAKAGWRWDMPGGKMPPLR